MKKKDVVIVVSTYKKWSDLDKNEQASLTNTLKVFSSRPIYLTHPKGMDMEGYEGFIHKCPLNLEFCTYKGYNELITRKEFYQIFGNHYRYLVIVQPDVWVFEDNLDYWIRKFDREGWDFIGAPWYGVDFVEDGTVGNGGFSIRRLDKFVDVFTRFKVEKGNEDVVICKVLAKEFKIAPEKIALKFSFEENPLHCYYLNKQKLPMGTHAYAKVRDRLNFWKKFISPIYNKKGEQLN